MTPLLLLWVSAASTTTGTLARGETVRVFSGTNKTSGRASVPIVCTRTRAFDDTMAIFDEFKGLSLPPVVVHCFTGTLQEAKAYIDRSSSSASLVQFAKSNEARLFDKILPHLPLERLMIETDAPWMGF